MNRALKILFIWLIFFALPMQGVAAATMVFCASGGHAAVSQHSGSMHHHDQHHHSDSQSDKSSKKSAYHGQSKCSVCAACCVGAAMVAPTIIIPSFIDGTQLISFTTQSFSSLVLKGLERPPFSYSFIA